jgi:hypothetical protein
MIHSSITNTRLPVARLLGAVDHPDFRDAVALLRSTARFDLGESAPPELVVIAQSRPNEFPRGELEAIQRRWPLAGIISIAGTWCEGELRTGKPWPGIRRLYWHEFPAWWQQQLAMRSDGRCPEWLRPTVDLFRASTVSISHGDIQPPIGSLASPLNAGHRTGLIVLCTQYFSTADMLADVFSRAGFATIWQRPGQPSPLVRGCTAAVWDGGQLDDEEACDLRQFSHRFARDSTPVVALLDYPRRDRADLARQLGASAVLGKPWINRDLIAVVNELAYHTRRVPQPNRRAA